MSKSFTKNKTYPFLEDSGETGELIRNHDWSNSSIGPISGWPLSLCTTLGNLLHSAFPMFLFWGEELLCFYNDAYRPSLGINGKHPAIGQRGESVWPEIWNFIHPLIENVLHTGKAAWFEDQLLPIYRNGAIEEVYWTFSYSPAYGDEGKIAGVLVTCMETTNGVLSRKRVNEIVSQRTGELERANDSILRASIYYQQIINLFKEPLQVLEPVFENRTVVDFRFKLTNAAYAAYANTTPRELQNKRIGEVFPGYFETTSFAKILEVYNTGIPETWENRYNVDGLDLYNQMSAARIDNEMIVHFTDFTKLKHLQLELLSKIEELERSNGHLEEFAHAASHDLKEPIRKIQVFITLLRDQLSEQLQESDRRTFDRIDNAARRMSNLVDDLLLYSHVSQRPHEMEAVDLNDKIAIVLEDLELDVQQKGAIIELQPLPVVRGYRRQLQQMFQNLISNALKYSRENVPPRISIRTETPTGNEANYYLVIVEDNGIGFEQQYAEKIFQMFTRLHGKHEYAGTGIGLSIVKKVVENHNGAIRAESTPGEGSRFRIYLPKDGAA